MAEARGTTSYPWLKHSDVLVAIALVMAVILMIIPVPTTLLDFLLAFNITFAILILLATFYIKRPLEFSVFPSLLLFTTLFRLGLNVSTTRWILLQGYAGRIILAFGQFVVGGNYIVGAVIFLILFIIQFIVITRGAERVAEVAARFTLDAMPGKQMSIDADLNAGLIDEKEARRRREEIQREADFYGAMDGASKFVKGDAIAGVFITLVNIIGGLIIGVLQRGLPLGEALQTYTLLTVGDGLVAQIPALVISTATAVIVSRAAAEHDLGVELLRQITYHPRPLIIGASILALFGAIPGLPTLPFWVLALIVGSMAYVMRRAARMEKIKKIEEEKRKEEEEVRKPESVLSLLQVDPMEIEIGYSLIPLVDPKQGGDLLDRITMIRRQIALELGLVVPPIRIRDNMQLKPNEYVIKIRGVEVGRGELIVDYYLAMNPGTAKERIEGIETKEPAFGLPALWISPEQRERAEWLGYTVVDPPAVLATHLTEIIKRHAAELLTRQEVQNLIDLVKGQHPALIEELNRAMSLGDIQKVLQGLLRERVPIRDLVTIFETLADYGRLIKDIDYLIEYVRQALSRQISKMYQTSEGFIPVVTLSPELEEQIRGSIQKTETGVSLTMDPRRVRGIVEKIAVEVEKLASLGYHPVLICHPSVRPYLRKILEGVLPQVAVISYNEVAPGVEVRSMGMVSS
ncbi:MAG: flagellar biosynthesis protein FlhA [Synergistetes bacterium]|nr:flagellar biosynthesis protein FlhA [Synergistota bacterium]MDW8193048.1 flagellar biosynthesis protein FlhA [Synergistota bacterium]